MKYPQLVCTRAMGIISDWLSPALERLGVDSVAVPRLLLSMLHKPLQLDANDLVDLSSLKQIIRTAIAADADARQAGDAAAAAAASSSTAVTDAPPPPPPPTTRPRRKITSIAAHSQIDELKCVAAVELLLKALGYDSATIGERTDILLDCVRLVDDLYKRVRAVERQSDEEQADGETSSDDAAVVAAATAAATSSAVSATSSRRRAAERGEALQLLKKEKQQQHVKTTTVAAAAVAVPESNAVKRYFMAFPSLSGSVSPPPGCLVACSAEGPRDAAAGIAATMPSTSSARRALRMTAAGAAQHKLISHCNSSSSGNNMNNNNNTASVANQNHHHHIHHHRNDINVASKSQASYSHNGHAGRLNKSCTQRRSPSTSSSTQSSPVLAAPSQPNKRSVRNAPQQPTMSSTTAPELTSDAERGGAAAVQSSSSQHQTQSQQQQLLQQLQRRPRTRRRRGGQGAGGATMRTSASEDAPQSSANNLWDTDFVDQWEQGRNLIQEEADARRRAAHREATMRVVLLDTEAAHSEDELRLKVHGLRLYERERTPVGSPVVHEELRPRPRLYERKGTPTAVAVAAAEDDDVDGEPALTQEELDIHLELSALVAADAAPLQQHELELDDDQQLPTMAAQLGGAAMARIWQQQHFSGGGGCGAGGVGGDNDADDAEEGLQTFWHNYNRHRYSEEQQLLQQQRQQHQQQHLQLHNMMPPADMSPVTIGSLLETAVPAEYTPRDEIAELAQRYAAERSAWSMLHQQQLMAEPLLQQQQRQQQQLLWNQPPPTSSQQQMLLFQQRNQQLGSLYAAADEERSLYAATLQGGWSDLEQQHRTMNAAANSAIYASDPPAQRHNFGQPLAQRFASATVDATHMPPTEQELLDVTRAAAGMCHTTAAAAVAAWSTPDTVQQLQQQQQEHLQLQQQILQHQRLQQQQQHQHQQQQQIYQQQLQSQPAPPQSRFRQRSCFDFANDPTLADTTASALTDHHHLQLATALLASQQQSFSQSAASLAAIPAPLVPQTLANHADGASGFARMRIGTASAARTTSTSLLDLAAAVAMSSNASTNSLMQPAQQQQHQQHPQQQLQPPTTTSSSVDGGASQDKPAVPQQIGGIPQLEHTHFTPIKDVYFDGHTFHIESRLPAVPFRRSPCGSRWLDNDRYMEFVLPSDDDEESGGNGGSGGGGGGDDATTGAAGAIKRAPNAGCADDVRAMEAEDDNEEGAVGGGVGRAPFRLMFRVKSSVTNDKACQTGDSLCGDGGDEWPAETAAAIVTEDVARLLAAHAEIARAQRQAQLEADACDFATAAAASLDDVDDEDEGGGGERLQFQRESQVPVPLDMDAWYQRRAANACRNGGAHTLWQHCAACSGGRQRVLQQEQQQQQQGIQTRQQQQENAIETAPDASRRLRAELAEDGEMLMAHLGYMREMHAEEAEDDEDDEDDVDNGEDGVYEPQPHAAANAFNGAGNGLPEENERRGAEVFVHDDDDNDADDVAGHDDDHEGGGGEQEPDDGLGSSAGDEELLDTDEDGGGGAGGDDDDDDDGDDGDEEEEEEDDEEDGAGDDDGDDEEENEHEARADDADTNAPAQNAPNDDSNNADHAIAADLPQLDDADDDDSDLIMRNVNQIVSQLLVPDRAQRLLDHVITAQQLFGQHSSLWSAAAASSSSSAASSSTTAMRLPAFGNLVPNARRADLDQDDGGGGDGDKAEPVPCDLWDHLEAMWRNLSPPPPPPQQTAIVRMPGGTLATGVTTSTEARTVQAGVGGTGAAYAIVASVAALPTTVVPPGHGSEDANSSSDEFVSLDSGTPTANCAEDDRRRCSSSSSDSSSSLDDNSSSNSSQNSATVDQPPAADDDTAAVAAALLDTDDAGPQLDLSAVLSDEEVAYEAHQRMQRPRPRFCQDQRLSGAKRRLWMRQCAADNDGVDDEANDGGDNDDDVVDAGGKSNTTQSITEESDAKHRGKWSFRPLTR